MIKEIELKVKEIIKRTYNVKSVRLAIDFEPDYKAGQFLLVSFKDDKDCKRYLSISSSPSEKGHIEFTKKITGSDFSKAVDALKPESSLLIQYPFGNFTLSDPKAKVCFISGGIGITPIRSICKYVIDSGLMTDMVLIYANRCIDDIAFRQDFDQMQKSSSNLKVSHVLCEPAEGFKCTTGLISSIVIKNEVPDYKERKFYLCGPPAMVESMKKILIEEMLVPGSSIITENFKGY